MVAGPRVWLRHRDTAVRNLQLNSRESREQIRGCPKTRRTRALRKERIRCCRNGFPGQLSLAGAASCPMDLEV